jgi:broad specificity phosphatase PhoE
MQLYLVRHAAVTLRENRPSAEWHLSPEGRAAADALAGDRSWVDLRSLYASTEPKAIATAQRIACRYDLPVYIEHDLREVERPWAGDGYRELVRRYFAGETVGGWERRDAALARIQRCVADVVGAAADQNVGIVSHGLVLTLFLSDLLAIDGDAAYEQWAAIAFPDVAVVERETRRLVRGWRGAG